MSNNASTPRPVPWHKWPEEMHHNDMVPVISIAMGEPSRDREDYAYRAPEQIRDYLAGYTDVDPNTVEMDPLVEEILDDCLRPGAGLQVYRRLLLHYVAKHRVELDLESAQESK